MKMLKFLIDLFLFLFINDIVSKGNVILHLHYDFGVKNYI